MPYKANENRRHKIPKACYRVENGAAYNAGLRRRGDLTIWVTPEAIASWTPPKSGRRGRPARYSDIAVEAGMMLRLAFGRPWRQTEGLLGSLMRLLGLTLPVPDHTIFSRRSADMAVAAALSSTDGPVSVVIDSTGLRVFGKGEWHLEKHGGQARRSWRKLHLAVDPDSGKILASALTTTEDGDASLVGPLLPGRGRDDTLQAADRAQLCAKVVLHYLGAGTHRPEGDHRLVGLPLGPGGDEDWKSLIPECADGLRPARPEDAAGGHRPVAAGASAPGSCGRERSAAAACAAAHSVRPLGRARRWQTGLQPNR